MTGRCKPAALSKLTGSWCAIPIPAACTCGSIRFTGTAVKEPAKTLYSQMKTNIGSTCSYSHKNKSLVFRSSCDKLNAAHDLPSRLSPHTPTSLIVQAILAVSNRRAGTAARRWPGHPGRHCAHSFLLRPPLPLSCRRLHDSEHSSVSGSAGGNSDPSSTTAGQLKGVR
eukprot:748857-Hanusia_phi.AAC.1